MSTFYRVTVASPGALTSPADGFIDQTSIERYMTLAAAPNGFNLALSRAKERANLRYAQVVAQLGLMANCYLSNWSAPAADAATEASSYVFTAEVERGDEALITRNEAGGADLTGAAAIKRCVARALLAAGPHLAQVYDPTLRTTFGNTVPAARNLTLTENITVGPLAANLTAAEALVTVAKIANVG